MRHLLTHRSSRSMGWHVADLPFATDEFCALESMHNLIWTHPMHCRLPNMQGVCQLKSKLCLPLIARKHLLMPTAPIVFHNILRMDCVQTSRFPSGVVQP